MKKKGFTLIELLAVIVILAIIALIATPIILNVINDAKENARLRTIDNIIHSAEIAYAQHQVKGEDVDFLTYDLSDESSGLNFTGERPNGTITIYPNGEIFLDAEFKDGQSYVKLPNSTSEELQTDGKIVGSGALWDTDGKGTIKKIQASPIALDVVIFANYVEGAYEFATYSRVDSNGNKIPTADKSIYELESSMIEPYYSKTFLTNSTLKQEIDYLLNLLNVKEQLSETEVNELLQKHAEKIPYAIDALQVIKAEGEIDGSNCINLKAYNLLKEKLDDSFIIIPNYVMHEDGTLEKITAIGDMAFVYSEWVGNSLNLVSTLNCILLDKKLNDISYEFNNITNKKGLNLIISNGIEKIGISAFSFSLLNSVKFPNTLKDIGDASFDLVYGIDTLAFPETLERIGDGAFLLSNLKGELIIPSNVKYIGISAFASAGNLDKLGTTNIEIKKYNNHITNVVFKPNSKIETIGQEAFIGNSITQLTLPASIKNIGSNAFNMSTLKNVIIKKQQGVDLTLGENAFGTANVSYQP